jgi:hypothetical protein
MKGLINPVPTLSTADHEDVKGKAWRSDYANANAETYNR